MSSTEPKAAHKVLLADNDDAVRAKMIATPELKGFDVVALAFLLMAVFISTATALGQATKSAATTSAPEAQQPALTIATSWTAKSATLKSKLKTLPKPCRRINTTSLRRA